MTDPTLIAAYIAVAASALLPPPRGLPIGFRAALAAATAILLGGAVGALWIMIWWVVATLSGVRRSGGGIRTPDPTWSQPPSIVTPTPARVVN